MAIELRQQLKLTQQLIMTPQLQMAIKLLQLSRLELMDTIRQELEENPTLEEVQSAQEDEQAGGADEGPGGEPAEEQPATPEVTIEERIPDYMDWGSFIDEYNAPGRATLEVERRDTPSFEAFLAKKESLNDHLLWQLLMSHPTPEERKIGSVIIGNLNRDGYLETSLDEIVRTTGSSPEKVEQFLAIMQTFDPVGVCARDLTECLLIQMRHLGLTNPHLAEMVTHHLNHMENKNYKAIAKALKTSLEEVIAAANLIQTLEPKPGRQFSNEEPQYITPDIFVYKHENEFVIVLNDDGMPKLRVSTFYKKALQAGQNQSETARDYIQEKLRSAAWLIRSIHQRQKTIYRVMFPRPPEDAERGRRFLIFQAASPLRSRDRRDTRLYILFHILGRINDQ